jgi:hypothetical protein
MGEYGCIWWALDKLIWFKNWGDVVMTSVVESCEIVA